MEGFKFDEISRLFGRGSSRRGVLGLIGAAVALRRNSALGAQLGPATCGASGDACTLLIGCCDGLTCATSTINPSYGVCVPGDGGMVAVGPSLISPFSEGIVEDIGTLPTSDPASTGTTSTDQQAARDARIAAQKARKNSRQTELQSRRTEQKTKRDDKRDAQVLTEGPALNLELFHAGGVDSVETVRVTNLSSLSAVVNRIETKLDPTDGTSFPTPVSLKEGEFVQFLSANVAVDPRSIVWSHNPICSDAAVGEGFTIFAAFSTNSVNTKYVLNCDGTLVSGTAGASPNGHKKPGKRKNRHDRARQRSKSRNQKKSGNR